MQSLYTTEVFQAVNCDKLRSIVSTHADLYMVCVTLKCYLNIMSIHWGQNVPSLIITDVENGVWSSMCPLSNVYLIRPRQLIV